MRDEEAHCEFVMARRPRCSRPGFLLTGDWHLPEDLAQTAPTKLYVAWTRIQRRDDVTAYTTGARWSNAYLDERRRPWRRESSVDAVPDRLGTEPDHPDPAMRERIVAGLAQVPARQRAALVLRYWEDLSVEHAADVLNGSSGTIKSQTAAAWNACARSSAPRCSTN